MCSRPPAGGMLLPVAALLLLAVAAVGLAPWLGGLLPQPHAAQGTLSAVATTPTPPPAAAPGTSSGTDYGAVLNRNLAARLGVDEATLNTAFAAAMSDTVAQAVRDGKLDQGASAKIKDAAQHGLGGVLPSFEEDVKAARDASAGVADERTPTCSRRPSPPRPRRWA